MSNLNFSYIINKNQCHQYHYSLFYFIIKYFLKENQNKLKLKSDSYAQRNKILKETKVIPRVVYEIEQFNKEILLLGKRTGVSIKHKY